MIVPTRQPPVEQSEPAPHHGLVVQLVDSREPRREVVVVGIVEVVGVVRERVVLDEDVTVPESETPTGSYSVPPNAMALVPGAL